MKKTITTALSGMAALALLSLPVSAAAFMKLGDLKGEATDSKHEEWINILSISQSISRPLQQGASGSTRQRASVVVGDLKCSKELDKSSPKIAEAVCKGTIIPSMVLEVTKPILSPDGAETGRATYYRYELKNVLVTSYSVSGSSADGEVPTEDFSLNFEEIKVTYTEYAKDGKKKGNVEYSWKVEEGES